MSIEKIADGAVILTEETGRRYLIRKHYRTGRSKAHTGWDVLWEHNGQWFQPPYFSHWASKADAIRHVTG